MPLNEASIVWLPTLLLVTVRVGGMMVFAPVLGHSAVPIRLRVVIAVAMGLAVVGRLGQPVALPAGWFELAAGVAGEAMIGAAIGYAARLIFMGVELGAFHVGSQMGLALGEAVNPLKADSPGAAAGLFRLLAVVIFLAVGGHRALIGGLFATFRALPPLTAASPVAVLDATVGMLGASFVLALKVAAPVLTALLAATVALGLLHKTMPQCNLLSVGLPIRAMLGMAVLAVSLGALAPLIDAAAGQLGRGIQALTTGGT